MFLPSKRIISLLDLPQDIRDNDSADELKHLFLTLDPNLGQIAGDEKKELISQLLDVFSIEKYKKGQTIYEQSSPPLKYYLILEGEVTMYLPRNGTTIINSNSNSISTSLIPVRQLQIKDSFGQKSLTYNKPHLCTCIASRETICAVLSQSDFIRYLKKPFSLQESKDINFLWELDYLKSLNFRKIKTLHNAAEIILYKTGQHVYKEDLDIANYAYIIKSGTFIIHKKVRPPSNDNNSNSNSNNSNPMHHLQLSNKKLVKKRICIMSIGELFGIEDLIENQLKRTYTVQCHSDEGELFAISKELFQVLIMTEPQCAKSIKRLYKAYSKRMANLIQNKEMYFMFRNTHNSNQDGIDKEQKKQQEDNSQIERSNNHQSKDHHKHNKHHHHHHKHHHHHHNSNSKSHQGQGYCSSSSSSSSSPSLSPSNHFILPTRSNNKKLTLQCSPSPISNQSQYPSQQSKGSIMVVSSINNNKNHNTHDSITQSKLESFTQALHNEHQQLLQKKTIDLNRRKTKINDEYNSPSNTSIGGQIKQTNNNNRNSIDGRFLSSVSQGNIGEKQFQFHSNIPHSPTVSLTLLESESQQQSKGNNDSSVSCSSNNSVSRDSSKNRIDKRQVKLSKHSKTLKLIGEKGEMQQQQQKQQQYSLPSSQDLIGDQSNDVISVQYQNNDNKPQEQIGYSRQLTHGSIRSKTNNSNIQDIISSDDGERNTKKRQSKRSNASTVLIQETQQQLQQQQQQQQQQSPQYSYSSKCLPILEEESIIGSRDNFHCDQKNIPHYSQFHSSPQQQKQQKQDGYPDNPRAVEVIGFVNKKDKNNNSKRDTQQREGIITAEIGDNNNQIEEQQQQNQQNNLEREVDYVSCYSYLPSISTFFLKKQASPIDQVMDKQHQHNITHPSKYSRDPVIIEEQQGQEEQEESKYQSPQQQLTTYSKQYSQSSEKLPTSRMNPQRKLAATLSTFQSSSSKESNKQIKNIQHQSMQNTTTTTTAYDIQFINQRTEPSSMNSNFKISQDNFLGEKSKHLSMNPSVSSLQQTLQPIHRSGSHTPTGYQQYKSTNKGYQTSKAKFMLGDPPKKEVIGIFNPQFFTKLKSKFLKEFTNNPQISKDIYQYKLEDFLKKHLHSGPLHEFLEKNEQVDSFPKKIEHEQQIRAKKDEEDFKRQSRLISCIASKKADGINWKWENNSKINKRSEEIQRKEEIIINKDQQIEEKQQEQQQQQYQMFNNSHNQSIDSSINVTISNNEKNQDKYFETTTLFQQNNINNSITSSSSNKILNKTNTSFRGQHNSMDKTGESCFSQQHKRSINSPSNCSPFKGYSPERQQTLLDNRRSNSKSDDNILERLLKQDNINTSSNGIVASRSYRGLHSLMRFSLPQQNNNTLKRNSNNNRQVTTILPAGQVQRMGLNTVSRNQSLDKKTQQHKYSKSNLNQIVLSKINQPEKKQEGLLLLPKQAKNYNDSFYRFNPKELQQQ